MAGRADASRRRLLVVICMTGITSVFSGAACESADADAGGGTCAGGWYDPVSGLCWQDPGPVDPYNWDGASAYCTGLSLGGHGPGSWRLPTIGELRSLIRGCPATETGGTCGVTDACLGEGCWNAACDGCSGLGPGAGGMYWPAGLGSPVYGLYGYWSSSSYSGSSSYAWLVPFNFGNVSRADKASSINVRCIRRGP